MAVQCAQCGEELLGAVNRCWRCGHEFEPHSGPSDLPPVRRSPPQRLAAAAVGVAAEETASPVDGEPLPALLVPSRRGSPFADRGSVVIEDKSEAAVYEALHSRRQGYGAATAAAALTFPIGFLALILAFSFPMGGVVVASFGIAIGTWGLYSPRRGVALSGLLLCCLCLALSGFNAAVEIYVHIYGVAPWETAEPLDVP